MAFLSITPLPKPKPFSPLLRFRHDLHHPTKPRTKILALNSGHSNQTPETSNTKRYYKPLTRLFPKPKNTNASALVKDDDLVQAVEPEEKKRSNRTNVFWRRTWTLWDMARAGGVVIVHLLSLLAPFQFSWAALNVAFVLAVATGVSVTLCYHRCLSHGSFKMPKWLEYLFAYCAALALQGDPIDWVSTHRHHHHYCDTKRDPHSPIQGFWHSHMNWSFDTTSIAQKCGGQNNVADLKKQPFYRFLQRTYYLHPIALGAVLYAFGGLPFLVWGVGVRIMYVYHITWLTNSVGHTWGNQAWNTGDLSKNNWWLGLLTLGEGWHNNHHAFEFSARHGLEWLQVDVTWYIIRFLEIVGLATDVKLPTEAQKQRMAFNN